MLKPLLALFAIALFTSCNIEVKGIKGSGNVTKQNRNLSGFTTVRAESGMDVTIKYGDAFEVTVEADDNVQPHIITVVENGTLIIKSDYNSFTDVTMEVSVKMPAIKGIEASSGSSIESQNTLISDNITIEAGSGSAIDVNVESDNISVKSSQGSTVELLGKALSLDAASSEGSTIDAESLIANDINARASSGSTTSVHAAVSLTAKASSGGSVDYKGNPANVTVDEGSGGSVTKQQ